MSTFPVLTLFIIVVISLFYIYNRVIFILFYKTLLFLHVYFLFHVWIYNFCRYLIVIVGSIEVNTVHTTGICTRSCDFNKICSTFVKIYFFLYLGLLITPEEPINVDQIWTWCMYKAQTPDL